MSQEYHPLIASALYSAITTYGKDRTLLRVFAQDFIDSLNRKGVIPNEKVDEALNYAYEYIDKETSKYQNESRRYGKPRTEGERLKRHFEKYGTIELPPRGTGLRKSSSSQIPTCPICGEPMKRIMGNLYQCPKHPTQFKRL